MKVLLPFLQSSIYMLQGMQVHLHSKTEKEGRENVTGS